MKSKVLLFKFLLCCGLFMSLQLQGAHVVVLNAASPGSLIGQDGSVYNLPLGTTEFNLIPQNYTFAGTNGSATVDQITNDEPLYECVMYAKEGSIKVDIETKNTKHKNYILGFSTGLGLLLPTLCIYWFVSHARVQV